MITDLEMNGIYRGAVEQFNLASNLRRNDALFPECVRTFATVAINTQAFFHRQLVASEVSRAQTYSVYVPPTRRPCLRSANAKSQDVDIYGFRPLEDSPFALLCVYEFFMYFCAEALLNPGSYKDLACTAWTTEGERV